MMNGVVVKVHVREGGGGAHERALRSGMSKTLQISVHALFTTSMETKTARVCVAVQAWLAGCSAQAWTER